MESIGDVRGDEGVRVEFRTCPRLEIPQPGASAQCERQYSSSQQAQLPPLHGREEEYIQTYCLLQGIQGSFSEYYAL